MTESQKDQQSRPKMFSEQEHVERLVHEIDRQRISVFQYEIKHGFQTYGNKMAPDVSIRLLGGDLAKVQELTLRVEAMVVDFVKNNPPRWPTVQD